MSGRRNKDYRLFMDYLAYSKLPTVFGNVANF